MVFILKKKKEKKKVNNKKHSSRTHSTPNWKGEESNRKIPEAGAPVFEELYELFKDYFHMTASDTEDFAVRDTWYGNQIDF